MRTVGELSGARMIEPFSSQSLLSLAEQYAIEGNIRKALRLYERAEELGETRVETRMHIARLYGALHDNKRAIAKYLRIAEDVTAVNDLSAATTALRQALHIEPDNTEVRQRLVACLLRSDRYDETIIESIELSNHLLKNRDLEGAVSVWQSFMDKYPASTEAHRQLSELYREQDNKTGAIRMLENLAVLYVERKRMERAAEVYREILRFDPRHTTVRLKLASLLRRIGNIKEAAEEYEQFRSTTRHLRFSDRRFLMLKSLLGLRNPAVAASARMALGSRVLQGVATIAIALFLAGILTFILTLRVSSQDHALAVRVGTVLFESLSVLQAVILFAVLPAIAAASVLFHPHEDEVGVATALALHPRAAVAGKFIAIFATWLILLSSTLPFAAASTALGAIGASSISFSFYMLLLLGAVTSAALTLVSANAPDHRHAMIDSYLASALLVATGLLIIGMLSDVSTPAGAGSATSISPTGLAEFQARTFTFAGAFLLMPAAAVFLCGMMLMGATARLMPERGYSGANQKLFWFLATLAGTVIGLIWASGGAGASSLSQPPVARLLILMSSFLALSVGAVVFPTESARGSAEEQERLKQLLQRSRLRRLLGPGPLRGTLFVLGGSALVLFLIVLFLGLSADEALAQPGVRTLASLYFSLLGILAMLAALGLLLSTTSLNTKRRRLILMAVLGVTVAVIPAVVAFLGLGLPAFATELSPVVFTAVALKEAFMLGGHVFEANAISWTPIVLTYWIAAVLLGGVSVLRLRKRAKPQTKQKGKAK
jgi:tetratricopeptide (TPR) repeat protein